VPLKKSCNLAVCFGFAALYFVCRLLNSFHLRRNTGNERICGTSLVTTEPAAVTAPSPTRTGATSIVSEPILTIVCRWSSRFYVRRRIAGNRSGADVGSLADCRSPK
jgi:hypothetical protein